MNTPHTNEKPNHPDDDKLHSQLLVDFPARGRSRRVRFASHTKVQPITSVTAVCNKQVLWYSRVNVDLMRREMKRDAYALARTLLSPSAEDLEEGIDVSEVVGLEKLVNPFQQRRDKTTLILQRRAVVSLQEVVQNEEMLRRISERYSSTNTARACTLAMHWVMMDGK